MDIPSYEKAIKKLLVLLLLLVVSPIVLNIAFKALKLYTKGPLVIVSFFLLFLGIILILYTVYHGFKTFKSFLDIIFRE